MIGAALIRRGLQSMRERGERLVIVPGHPEYHPRFGFSTAAARHLAHPFRPEAFMALELAPGDLTGVTGAVRYPKSFGLSG